MGCLAMLIKNLIIHWYSLCVGTTLFDFFAIAAASSTSRLANAIAEEEMPFDSGPLGSGSWLVGLKYCRIDMINE